jgi:hypothetical protein
MITNDEAPQYLKIICLIIISSLLDQNFTLPQYSEKPLASILTLV